MDPSAVAFTLENAFSFGFAKNVYSATLPDGGELFVTPAGPEGEAADLARRFVDGFHQYGDNDGDFIRDRYLDTYATATAAGAWVVGIHRAADAREASAAIARLVAAVKDLPLPDAGSEPAAAANANGEYETDEY
jgi:hypothetical protein